MTGIAGNQQAATVGQACFPPGMVKSTYGTGCFLLLHAGDRPVASRTRHAHHGGLQLAGQRTYALEGAIFVAGAAVQWLRDGLRGDRDAAETGALAARADPQQSVYLVPAFVGLGAPHWDAGGTRRAVRPHPRPGPRSLRARRWRALRFRPGI